MKCKWRMEDEPDIEALRVCALLGAVYAARRESVCERRYVGVSCVKSGLIDVREAVFGVRQILQ